MGLFARRTPIENRTGVDDLKAQVELLRWCDSFVLVYPTWWYGLPAILKVIDFFT